MTDLAPLQQPACCPHCGGLSVLRILGGRPSADGCQMIERGEAIAGSCFLSPDNPDWYCKQCHHRWFVKDDPVRLEREALLARMLSRFNHGSQILNEQSD